MNMLHDQSLEGSLTNTENRRIADFVLPKQLDVPDMSTVPKKLSVCRNTLLEFFDEAPTSSRKHATSIVAIAGEELGLVLACDFLRSVEPNPRLLRDEICTQGTKKGSRLDGWIQTDRHLYQVEVKNWSAHAIDGKTLARNASEDELSQHRALRWQKVWNEEMKEFRSDNLRKVMTPMKPPIAGLHVKPMLAFWFAMHPEGKCDPMFSVKTNSALFPEIAVFSMSNYLRRLSDDYISLEMPNTVKRMTWLDTMFKPKNP